MFLTHHRIPPRLLPRPWHTTAHHVYIHVRVIVLFLESFRVYTTQSIRCQALLVAARARGREDMRAAHPIFGHGASYGAKSGYRAFSSRFVDDREESR
jgi:hypothetical protein